jgi:hypothetical protein
VRRPEPISLLPETSRTQSIKFKEYRGAPGSGRYRSGQFGAENSDLADGGSIDWARSYTTGTTGRAVAARRQGNVGGVGRVGKRGMETISQPLVRHRILCQCGILHWEYAGLHEELLNRKKLLGFGCRL